jgi:putative flippase GtrA
MLSGGTAAVVLLGLSYLLTDVIGVWYLASSVIAFIGAFCTSFTLHKFVTFVDDNLARAPAQAGGHFSVALLNLALNTGLLYGLVEYLGLYYLVAQVIVSATLAVGSYFVYKHLVFHRGRAGADPEV